MRKNTNYERNSCSEKTVLNSVIFLQANQNKISFGLSEPETQN